MSVRPKTVAAACAAVLLSLAVPPAQASAARQASDVIEGRYIVVYEPGVAAQAATEELERRHRFKTRLRYGKAVRGFAAKLTDAQRDKVARDPDVAFVAPDRRVHATGALAAGDTVPAGIRRIGAATATTTRDAAKGAVAVIDTGIDMTHPDLNVTGGVNCVSPNAAPQDDNGHGTHVAGTIGARNDGGGVVGVAPGTSLKAVKVLSGGGVGSTSSIICGLDWVTSTRTDADPDNDVVVANMSLGGPGAPVRTCATTIDPQHAAICRAIAAGVTIVVAAGNDGWDFDYAAQPDLPAAYPEVLTVTSMADTDGRSGALGAAPACGSGGADDRYSPFSNFAATAAGAAHTIAAPGSCIASTAVGGGTTTMSGTSMATPHIAGLVALCLGDGATDGPCAGKTPAGVIAQVRGAAAARGQQESAYGFGGDPLRPLTGRTYGHLATTPPAVATETPETPATPAPDPTPARVHHTRTPSLVTPQSGYVRSGSASSVAADDSSTLQVNSSYRVAAWYGSVNDVPRTLSGLRVTYLGSNSASCAQTVALWNAASGVWVTLDSRTVGTTEARIDVAASGNVADYVGPDGATHVRVRCASSWSSFYTRADLLRIEYDA